MDATTTFLADVTVALIAGSLAGAGARALRIAPAVGYLLAGVVIGPFTPGYAAHGESLSGLAELGLIFLLFSLGLSFSVEELLEIGAAGLAGNLAAMAATAAAVWFAAAKFGLPHPITLALAFTVSSTAIGVALLQILGLLDRRAGRMAVSLLIVQDLLAVMVLVVITTPAQSLTLGGVGIPLLRAAVFVAVALALGATVLHRLFVFVLHRASADLLVVIFSAVALAAAWVGHLAGLTFEFGAFVAGAVTSEAAGSRIVASIVQPFRELFVMLFFVSMGTLADVPGIAAYWKVFAGIAAVAIVVRWLMFTSVGRIVRLGAGSAVALGFTLLPMGEFNIVLGNASFAAGRLNREEMTVLVGSSLISIAAAALFVRAGERRLPKLDRSLQEPVPEVRTDSPVVVIGYGRVGRTVTRMLRENNVGVAVIEREPGLVRRAQAEGIEAVYGDASDPRALDHFVTSKTRVVLISSPDSSANGAVARWLRARRDVAVIARAQSPGDVARLLETGAATALVPEVEGARAFGNAVIRALRKDGWLIGPQE